MKLPGFTRDLGVRALTFFPEQQLNRAFDLMTPGLPGRMRQKPPGSRAHRLAELLALTDAEQIYCSLISHWKSPGDIVIGGTEPLSNLTDPEAELSSSVTDFRERMMYLDQMSYLPDDILTKVDRASMGVSLEARVPFLDHRIVEFSWSLPMDYKVRDGEEKWVLRKALEKYVPRNLFDRPKMGFSIPVGEWLKGDLRDWAEDLLDEGRLKQEGYFDPQPIRQLWNQHLSGQGDPSYLLWDVLMFQSWRDEWYGSTQAIHWDRTSHPEFSQGNAVQSPKHPSNNRTPEAPVKSIRPRVPAPSPVKEAAVHPPDSE